MSAPLETERPPHYLSRLAASDFGRAYKSLVIAELEVAPSDTVVDLGCGPGADLAALAAAVGDGGRVLGIDADPAAVAEATAVSMSWPQVEVQVGDVHRLGLAQSSVDRLHADRVLQHVTDPAAVVAEAARVLRPGGRAAFAEPDWDTLVVDFPGPGSPIAYRRFITERTVRNARIGRELPALCTRHGLQVREVIPVTAIFRDLTAADQVLGFQRVTARAVAAGYLSAEAGEAWLHHLRTGEVFASVTLFVTLAETPTGSS